MESVRTRRPCFVEEVDRLASLADMEAGFSGNCSQNHSQALFTKSFGYSRRGSLRNVSVCSPRSARFYDARFEGFHGHFLEACFLCNKPLGDNRDIFMYRGDTPFCSEDCRQEQIEIDGAKEKKRNLSTSVKAIRKKDQKRNPTSSNESSTAQDYPLRTGTVAAA